MLLMRTLCLISALGHQFGRFGYGVREKAVMQLIWQLLGSVAFAEIFLTSAPLCKAVSSSC